MRDIYNVRLLEALNMSIIEFGIETYRKCLKYNERKIQVEVI